MRIVGWRSRGVLFFRSGFSFGMGGMVGGWGLGVCVRGYDIGVVMTGVK